MKSVAWKSCFLPLSIIKFWSLWWDQPSIKRHSCSCSCFASSTVTHEGWSPEACSASKPRVCCSSLQASTPPRLKGAVSGQRHQIWPRKGRFLFSQQRLPLLTVLHFSFSFSSWWYVPFTLNKWSYTSGRKPIWALSTYFPTILCVGGPFRAEGSDGTMIGVPRHLGRNTLPTTPEDPYRLSSNSSPTWPKNPPYIRTLRKSISLPQWCGIDCDWNHRSSLNWHHLLYTQTHTNQPRTPPMPSFNLRWSHGDFWKEHCLYWFLTLIITWAPEFFLQPWNAKFWYSNCFDHRLALNISSGIIVTLSVCTYILCLSSRNLTMTFQRSDGNKYLRPGWTNPSQNSVAPPEPRLIFPSISHSVFFL